MTTLLLISFIVLWIVIIGEGILLFQLYRHVALVYAPKGNGLAVGTPAPHLVAYDSVGRKVPLQELLTTDHVVLVFGSPTCAGCRSLLRNRDVRRLLSMRSVPGYFLSTSGGTTADIITSLRSVPSLDVLTIENKALHAYAVASTPFAYVVARTGTISARGLVGGPEDLVELCDDAYKRDHVAAQPSSQIPAAQHLGR